MKTHFENVKQQLIENMADFLDNPTFQLDEKLSNIKDDESREKSELHIRMAEASFQEYYKTMNKQP